MYDLEFYLACFFLTFGSLIVLYLLIKYLYKQIAIRKMMKNGLKRQVSSKDQIAGGKNFNFLNRNFFLLIFFVFVYLKVLKKIHYLKYLQLEKNVLKNHLKQLDLVNYVLI